LSAAKGEGCRAEAESAGGLGLTYTNHRSKLRLGKPVFVAENEDCRAVACNAEAG